MTEIFALQSFVALAVNSVLGIYVIRKNPGAPANRSFALINYALVRVLRPRGETVAITAG